MEEEGVAPVQAQAELEEMSRTAPLAGMVRMGQVHLLEAQEEEEEAVVQPMPGEPMQVVLVAAVVPGFLAVTGSSPSHGLDKAKPNRRIR